MLYIKNNNDITEKMDFEALECLWKKRIVIVSANSPGALPCKSFIDHWDSRKVEILDIDMLLIEI